MRCHKANTIILMTMVQTGICILLNHSGTQRGHGYRGDGKLGHQGCRVLAEFVPGEVEWESPWDHKEVLSSSTGKGHVGGKCHQELWGLLPIAPLVPNLFV